MTEAVGSPAVVEHTVDDRFWYVKTENGQIGLHTSEGLELVDECKTEFCTEYFGFFASQGYKVVIKDPFFVAGHGNRNPDYPDDVFDFFHNGICMIGILGNDYSLLILHGGMELSHQMEREKGTETCLSNPPAVFWSK